MGVAGSGETRIGRQLHFFNAGLLQSQFDTLEEPADAVAIDASQPPEVIVSEIKERLAIA